MLVHKVRKSLVKNFCYGCGNCCEQITNSDYHVMVGYLGAERINENTI